MDLMEMDYTCNNGHNAPDLHIAIKPCRAVAPLEKSGEWPKIILPIQPQQMWLTLS